MIKVTLTNEILRYITEIEQNRYKVSSVKLSQTVMNRLRKNSKKKSSYALKETPCRKNRWMKSNGTSCAVLFRERESSPS